MPARVSVPPRSRVREPIPISAWAIFSVIGTVVAATIFQHQTVMMINYFFEPSPSVAHAAGPKVAVKSVAPTPAPQVRIDFVPPAYLEQDQLDNLALQIKIAMDPASEGLTDKSPIVLDHNGWELLKSLGQFENQYRHFDDNGQVAYSYNDCCVGYGQVHLETSVCEKWELFVMERNMWCAAKIFEGYYNWSARAGARQNEITIAMYKNAVVMKPDLSDFEPDENGLPIIPADDPNDPMDFFSQVQTVFIDPSTGLPRFKFTPI